MHAVYDGGNGDWRLTMKAFYSAKSWAFGFKSHSRSSQRLVSGLRGRFNPTPKDRAGSSYVTPGTVEMSGKIQPDTVYACIYLIIKALGNGYSYRSNPSPVPK